MHIHAMISDHKIDNVGLLITYCRCSAKSFHFYEVERIFTIIHLDNDISARGLWAWNTNHQSLFHSLNLTWDDDMLPISARSSKMAKEGSAREHLACRGRKLIRDADIDISSSFPTPILSVENLNPVDGDRSAVVNGKPGCSVPLCVADWPSITVDTVGRFSSTMCGWLAGTYRLQLEPCVTGCE